MNDSNAISLSPVTRRFILHWGAMGTRWGVNRTVAQIHALLFLSETPLHAEQIAETLGVARSNVSTSLRELQSWGIVRVVPVLGDRRDHFESEADVWEMFKIVLQERKRREFDPTLEALRESVAELEAAGKGQSTSANRMRDMLEFFESTTSLYEEVRRLPSRALRRLMRMGTRIRRLVEPRRRRHSA